MKVINIILFMFVCGIANAGPLVLYGSNNVEKGTASNPVSVSFAGGSQKITGDLEVTGNVGIGSSAPRGVLDVFSGTGVGIGTSSPQTALEVVGTVKATNFGINTTSPTAKISVMNSGSETLLSLGNTTPGDAVIVTSAGNVGIGSTAPQQKLEVDGGIYPKGGNYYSSDGTVGVTVTTCTGFKNGLCVSGT